MKTIEKVALALAVGLTSGFALGVLFAPHKGSKTRRLIKEQGQKVAYGIQDKVDKAKRDMSDLKQQVRQAVKEAACGPKKEELQDV